MWVLIILLFIVSLYKYTTLETFHGWRRGGARWRGGDWNRQFHPRGYLRRFRRRRASFPYLNTATWLSPWYTQCNCKIGCTPNGCAFPGSGPDDCVWASDCNCC